MELGMRRLFMKILVGVVALLVTAGISTATDAREPMVLTVIATDGSLWALPEGHAPRLVARDLGGGKAVTDLAWSPTQPQLLIVRRENRGGDPFDSLVRVELLTGAEETIEENIGPQARLLHPSWRPDGSGGIARIECCLDRQLVRFSFPSGAGSSNRIGASEFLPPEQRDVSLAEAGFINAGGEIVVSVHCCMGEEPENNPAGIYAVSEDFQSSRRLAAGNLGVPIGSPTDGSWLATLLPQAESDGYRLVVVEQDGSSSELESPAELPLSDAGIVLPDGTIAVATRPAGVLSVTPRYVDVWTFSPTDTPPRKLTEGYKSGITAFGFVSSSVLREIPAQATASASPIQGDLTSPIDAEKDISGSFQFSVGQ
jgi:hypothetical protein